MFMEYRRTSHMGCLYSYQGVLQNYTLSCVQIPEPYAYPTFQKAMLETFDGYSFDIPFNMIIRSARVAYI